MVPLQKRIYEYMIDESTHTDHPNTVDIDIIGQNGHQQDKPGVVAHITQSLSEQEVNIAFMRLFREARGASAYTVVESDEIIPEKVLDKIRTNPNVSDLMLIQM